MPLLFSYGTLQQRDVQLATFGRRLTGEPDALVAFEPALVEIEDAQLAADLRRTHHANARFTGNGASRVPGTVFEISAAELDSADRFEAPFQYRRVLATLASGRDAWVYVHTDGAGDATGT